MPKDTQEPTKLVPFSAYLFDAQQLAFAHSQHWTPAEWVPARNVLCPVLVGCQVRIRAAERALKEIARADKQRAQRQQDKENGVLRARVKPTRYAAPLPAPTVDPQVPARLVWPQRELEAALARLDGRRTASKRVKRPVAPADEPNVHNKEITPPPLEADIRHAKGRLKALATADFLQARGGLEVSIQNPLFKAQAAIRNCNKVALLQHVNAGTNYKLGSALCKNRLCPVCQRALAGKRRANFLDWFELNRRKLRKYFFYHLVLTVRHSSADGVRTGLYTPDMLAYFAQLRGTHDSLSGAEQRRLSRVWNEYVQGGSYGVELKAGRDKSPHIHIHVFLIGNRKLHNWKCDSAFLAHVRREWLKITGDSDGVFVLPVYYLGENGEPVYCSRGSDANVERAAMECMKYTIKADAADLAGYSNAFLVSLLTMRNRYYSRFGCLSGNDKRSAQFEGLDMLCADYQDLERLTRLELARLFDPETGELIEKEDTQLLVAPYSVLRAKPGQLRLHDETGGVVEPARGESLLGGETYYELLPAKPGQLQWFQYHERERAAVLLSLHVKGDYDPSTETEMVRAAREERPARKRRASPVVKSPLSLCRPRRFARGLWYARPHAPAGVACSVPLHGVGDVRPRRAYSHKVMGARYELAHDVVSVP